MIARLSSLVVWGLVALAAVAWGLRIGGRSTPVPAHAAVADASSPMAGDLGRLLGTPPAAAPADEAPPPVADTRYRLVGVVAARGGRADGVALIAVDGLPPRTLRQGREIEPGLVLKSVSHRRVELVREGRPPLVLELPPLPEAQRGRPGESPMAAAPGVAGGAGVPVPPPGAASPGFQGSEGAPPMPVSPAAGNRVPMGIAPGQTPPVPPAGGDAPPAEAGPATR